MPGPLAAGQRLRWGVLPLWLCPLLARLDGGSLGDRVSVERWRRLGPVAREGGSTGDPVLWLPQPSRPLSPVSAPGGLRVAGRGQRSGEERGLLL